MLDAEIEKTITAVVADSMEEAEDGQETDAEVEEIVTEKAAGFFAKSRKGTQKTDVDKKTEEFEVEDLNDL